ncbi:MAG: ROK family protein [Phycisphaerales bacterium]
MKTTPITGDDARPVTPYAPPARRGPATLVIDVGGSNIKVLATGQTEERKSPSGPEMTAAQMVEAVKRMADGWSYDQISIGFPGPVVRDRPLAEPHNLGTGWVEFDFSAALDRPVRMINDAAMQALGGYRGGRMLFLGLGTGLGSALISEGVVQPMELAHLPYRRGRTFEDYVGLRGLKRLGKKKWRKHVERVATALKAALCADDLIIGGGNAKELDEIPAGGRLGANTNAFIGGFRLWDGALA